MLRTIKIAPQLTVFINKYDIFAIGWDYQRVFMVSAWNKASEPLITVTFLGIPQETGGFPLQMVINA